MNWRQLLKDALARLWNSIRKRYLPDIPGDPDTPDNDPSDFDGVKWLHTDVSGWPVTTRIEGVYFRGGQIQFPFDAASRWPGRTDMGTSTLVVGNVWLIFIYNGEKLAVTWEWLRPGQTAKKMSAVGGHKMQRSPIPSSWRPTSGESYELMVSTHARGKISPLRERSNVVRFVWP